MSLLDRLESVLVVHAHPDDETISTGALITELVARGTRVLLLTATRGERGEVVPGPLAALAGTEKLTRVREGELQRAAETLGIEQQFWLGEPPARGPGVKPRRYRDSGMRWIRTGLAGPADDTDDNSLVAAPLGEVTQDVAGLIAHLSPSLVISYDENGGYGHPDHVRIREAALNASQAHATPFAEILHPISADPGIAAAEYFTLDSHIDTLKAALDCHQTQLTVDGPDIIHSGGQREPITTSVGLRIV